MNQDEFHQQQFFDNQFSQQHDSGLKAWGSNNACNNTSLLRNLKTQLNNYEQKFHKQNFVPMPIRLPFIDNYRKKSSNNSNKRSLKDKQNLLISKPLTQRKSNPNLNKEPIYQHKSIQLNRMKPNFSKALDFQTFQKASIVLSKPSSIPLSFHELKFKQNGQFQKRIRKRDIYLSIFGQKGKGKVQKIVFDNQLDVVNLQKNKDKERGKKILQKKESLGDKKKGVRKGIRF